MIPASADSGLTVFFWHPLCEGGSHSLTGSYDDDNIVFFFLPYEILMVARRFGYVWTGHIKARLS